MKRVNNRGSRRGNKAGGKRKNANVWADKQYYKLISRNRVPFVRYAGAGCGLISSKWCNRPWRVTLQYQFDPANGPSVPRNCKQTYSKGVGGRPSFRSFDRHELVTRMDWLTFSPLPPSCYYLNNALFHPFDDTSSYSSNVFERRESSTSSSTRYTCVKLVVDSRG